MNRSERQWTPENPDKEPFVKLTLPSGEEILATRQNTTLYTHLGRLAVYDHAFYCEVKEEEVQQSFYIFNFVDGYKSLAKYMKRNKYPHHSNMTEISQSDVEAYERASLRDLGDFVPEDW